jgi:hypothetical protein
MRFSNYSKLVLLTFVVLVFASFRQPPANSRSFINLTGSWQFNIDPADIGIKQQWFARNLPDSIQLPGTTDLSKKGFKNKDTTTLHLNRVYTYVGPAWYRKSVFIQMIHKQTGME